MGEISRDEFNATMIRLYQTIDSGFAGTHERLDVLNGRTGRNEVDVGRLDARVTNLEEGVFEQPQRRAEDMDATLSTVGKQLPPKFVFALILIGLAGVFEGLRHLVPSLIRLLVAP